MTKIVTNLFPLFNGMISLFLSLDLEMEVGKTSSFITQFFINHETSKKSRDNLPVVPSSPLFCPLSQSGTADIGVVAGVPSSAALGAVGHEQEKREHQDLQPSSPQQMMLTGTELKSGQSPVRQPAGRPLPSSWPSFVACLSLFRLCWH